MALKQTLYKHRHVSEMFFSKLLLFCCLCSLFLTYSIFYVVKSNFDLFYLALLWYEIFLDNFYFTFCKLINCSSLANWDR